MTTTQDTPSVGDLLRKARDGRAKAPVYRLLGVSAQTYDHWEHGLYTPNDEYAERLADYLGLPIRDVVWILYQDRVKSNPDGVVPLAAPLGRRTVDYGTNKGPKDNRPSNRLPDALAA